MYQNLNDMKIDITQPFAKYRLIRPISRTYKTEIYEAEAKDGTRVFMKIHDNSVFLDVEKTCALNEASLLDKLSSKQFPKVVESGTVTRPEGTFTYLCFKYFEYQTMREYCSDRGFDEETALIIAREILWALGELKEITDGGGHYNICPDTVLLPKNRTDIYKKCLSSILNTPLNLVTEAPISFQAILTNISVRQKHCWVVILRLRMCILWACFFITCYVNVIHMILKNQWMPE